MHVLPNSKPLMLIVWAVDATCLEMFEQADKLETADTTVVRRTCDQLKYRYVYLTNA